MTSTPSVSLRALRTAALALCVAVFAPSVDAAAQDGIAPSDLIATWPAIGDELKVGERFFVETSGLVVGVRVVARSDVMAAVAMRESGADGVVLAEIALTPLVVGDRFDLAIETTAATTVIPIVVGDGVRAPTRAVSPVLRLRDTPSADDALVAAPRVVVVEVDVGAVDPSVALVDVARVVDGGVREPLVERIARARVPVVFAVEVDDEDRLCVVVTPRDGTLSQAGDAAERCVDLEDPVGCAASSKESAALSPMLLLAALCARRARRRLKTAAGWHARVPDARRVTASRGSARGL